MSIDYALPKPVKLTRKRSKLKKVTKTKIGTLKRKLWKIFGLYIRTRDKFACFTCNTSYPNRESLPYPSAIQAGHYIPKSICGNELYFHEKNVHAQCYHCNINLGGYGVMYHQKMLSKYGQHEVDELWRIKNQVISKWDENKYLEKIIEYRKKISELSTV